MENQPRDSGHVNAPIAPILTFTWFKTAFALTGTAHAESWGQFAKRLGNLAECAAISDVKEELPCFVLGKFTDGRALKSSLECTFAVGLDYDHATVDFETACAFWSNCDAIAYTTWSHTEEAPRFRVLLRLSRPILPAEHARVWRHLAELAGGEVDSQAANAERKWFVPAVAPGKPAPLFRSWDGEPIDVDRILALGGGPKAPAETNGHSHTAPHTNGHAAPQGSDMDRVYRIADAIAVTPKGARNFEWNREVYTLGGMFAAGRLDPALSEAAILAILLGAMKANASNGEREARKLQRSWEDGKRHPLERTRPARAEARPTRAPDKEPDVSGEDDGEVDLWPPAGKWMDTLAVTEKGGYRASTSNFKIILENADFARPLIFDEFYDSLFIDEDKPRAFDEHADLFAFNTWLSKQHLPELPADRGFAMLLGYTKRARRRNALQDHLQALVWDGKKRLDTWLVQYLGAEDTPFVRRAGRLWLISAMARAFRPGCQADYALIFEGPQGIGKSSALRILGGEFYSGNLSPIGTKDAYQEIQRVWIQELSELEAFNRGQIEAIKNFLTCTNDIYRPSYGKIAKDHPRHTVFAGSSNEGEYLKDQTGNRRFWPIKVSGLDAGALVRDRDALLAEALLAFVSGERWWPDQETSTLAAEEQEKRRTQHPWEGPIERFVHLNNRDQVTTDEIRQHLNVELGRWTVSDAKACGTILRSVLGWGRVRRRVAGVATWVYVRPGDV